jgi:branched-chain amino acid transport system substrate-binding protein
MQRRALLRCAGQVAALQWGGMPLLSRAQPSGLGDARLLLGQSAPFSGASEQLGLQVYLGAQLHFDAVNQKGGIHGRRIELKRLVNTRQFLSEGAFALFGYVGTSSCLAALPLATEAKVPFFAPASGAQALRTPFNRYAVHVRASYLDETAAIVRQITGAGMRRIAVFHQNDAYGTAGLDGVVRALNALDLSPVSLGTVERNSVEVSPALDSILAERPDAIVQIGLYKACAVFIRRARARGYTGGFYNVSFVGTQALLDELGALAKGVTISQVVPFPYIPVTALASEYLGAVKARRGLAPNHSSMEGFIAAKVFTEAAQRAGRGLTREGFLDALESLHGLDLGGFPLSFGPGKHTGSRFVELTLLTEDGRIRR